MKKTRLHCGEKITDYEAYADACVEEIVILRSMLVTLFEVSHTYMPDNLKHQWNEFIENEATEAADHLLVMYAKATK